MKIIYADYEMGFAIIEMIGEWNDAIENDIMELKREIIDHLSKKVICKFILICENVLNFHSSDKEYYQEWYDDVSEENGWIVALNMPQQTQQDFRQKKLHYYIELMEIDNWRNFKPGHLFEKINLIRRFVFIQRKFIVVYKKEPLSWLSVLFIFSIKTFKTFIISVEYFFVFLVEFNIFFFFHDK